MILLVLKCFFRTNKTPQFPCNLGSFNECSTYLIPFFDSQCISLLWYHMVSDIRVHGNTLSLDEKRDPTWLCISNLKLALIPGIRVWGQEIFLHFL